MKIQLILLFVLNIGIASSQEKSIIENDSIIWIELTYRSETKQTKIDLKK